MAPGFSDLPGIVGPHEVEAERGRLPRVPSGGGVGDAIAARLGSMSDPAKVAIAALAPLRAHLERDTWEALLDELPFTLRGLVASADAHLGPVPRLQDGPALAAYVGRHAQQPAEYALVYVGAVWGALRSALPAGLDTAVERELSPELAPLWLSAR